MHSIPCGCCFLLFSNRINARRCWILYLKYRPWLYTFADLALNPFLFIIFTGTSSLFLLFPNSKPCTWASGIEQSWTPAHKMLSSSHLPGLWLCSSYPLIERVRFRIDFIKIALLMVIGPIKGRFNFPLRCFPAPNTCFSAGFLKTTSWRQHIKAISSVHFLVAVYSFSRKVEETLGSTGLKTCFSFKSWTFPLARASKKPFCSPFLQNCLQIHFAFVDWGSTVHRLCQRGLVGGKKPPTLVPRHYRGQLARSYGDASSVIKLENFLWSKQPLENIQSLGNALLKRSKDPRHTSLPVQILVWLQPFVSHPLE